MWVSHQYKTTSADSVRIMNTCHYEGPQNLQLITARNNRMGIKNGIKKNYFEVMKIEIVSK